MSPRSIGKTVRLQSCVTDRGDLAVGRGGSVGRPATTAFRFKTESSLDFVQGGSVNPRRQITVLVERWDHFVGSFEGSSGFHSRANCRARWRTGSLIVWSAAMAASQADCGWPWSRRK